jgi:hypothetical protein
MAACLLARFYERPIRQYLASVGARANMQLKQQA